MKTEINQINQAAKQLADELRALAAEAEKAVENSTADGAEELLNELRERFEAAQERVADFYTGTKKKVAEGARSTDEAIRENPYQSLAIAAGAGLIVGLLLSRRSR
jgi:ElaB/YqjD/DUF883 family membrane-anchored ribosome-binding protein